MGGTGKTGTGNGRHQDCVYTLTGGHGKSPRKIQEGHVHSRKFPRGIQVNPQGFPVVVDLPSAFSRLHHDIINYAH